METQQTTTQTTQPEQTGAQTQQTTTQTTQPTFDYDKLASIIQGKQTVAEEVVLKNYFKQQGLNQDEAAQAIAAFKQQKQASTPDIAALQASLAEAQKAAAEATTAGKLQMAAIKLGIDATTLPYVLRLADTSTLTGEAKDEEYTAVISKVLEDLPQLKKDATKATGFQQVGAGSTGQAQSNQEDALKKIFGN